MGRGSSKIGGGSGGAGGNIKGDVDFATILKASDNSISFNKFFTLLPSGQVPTSGKKGDLAATLNEYNIKDAVVNMYRDKSGANDLKRLKDAGFEIVAQYKAPDTGSAIPPRDYYYIKRK